ncbi:MAG: peptidylprolyl isomerase [Planctomycetota bacterium]
MKIDTGSVVELSYEVYDADGELFESSDEGPISIIQGDGVLPPGLESALLGKEEGAELDLTLGPEDAYGAHNPDGIISVPRTEFPADVELARGEWITVVLRFDEDEAPPQGDGEDDEMEMRIVEASDEEVILDGNHPLAGQDVTFKLKVVAVHGEE